jgi:hypothetical protein
MGQRDESVEPVIMVAEGTSPRYQWRQYFVISDERCVIVEMVPALLCGWRFNRLSVQSADDWSGYTRDQIVAYKLASAHPPAMAPDLGSFRAKLVDTAARGALPQEAS